MRLGSEELQSERRSITHEMLIGGLIKLEIGLKGAEVISKYVYDCPQNVRYCGRSKAVSVSTNKGELRELGLRRLVEGCTLLYLRTAGRWTAVSLQNVMHSLQHSACITNHTRSLKRLFRGRASRKQFAELLRWERLIAKLRKISTEVIGFL
ncbi:hypothetical protein Tcan_01551, partial [Toxocara canis]